MKNQETNNLLKVVAEFLNKNNLSIGYTCGTSSGSKIMFELGLTYFNPRVFGLIDERHIAENIILLDKKSYKLLKNFLSKSNITYSKLKKQNIVIRYDKRLDNMILREKYSLPELNKLAKSVQYEKALIEIKSFNDYLLNKTLWDTLGLMKFWGYKRNRIPYFEIIEKYPFLKTKKSKYIILFQEQWMRIIKKITNKSYSEINLFRKEVSRYGNELRKILQLALIRKCSMTEKDANIFIKVLFNCAKYLSCKAHMSSESIIEFSNLSFE